VAGEKKATGGTKNGRENKYKKTVKIDKTAVNLYL
jgi:hypothetical protein